METIDNIRCLTQDEITGIMSVNVLRHAVQRGITRRVRRASYGRPALYDIDTLPMPYRAEAYRRWPDHEATQRGLSFSERVRRDTAAWEYYSAYYVDGDSAGLGGTTHLPPQAVEEYTAGASILNACRALLSERDAMRLRSGKRPVGRGEFWHHMAEALPAVQDRWPNSLPQNARCLQRKYDDYCDRGYIALVSQKYCNRNAAKIATEEQRALLLSLAKCGNNLDYAQIARAYNDVARRMVPVWPCVTASAVQKWCEKHLLETTAGRRGAAVLRNTLAMQTTRSRPTGAMLLWELDGWTAELYYQQDGSPLNRLTLEVVLDPCCNYPVGYAIGTHENADLIRTALGAAVRHTAELFGSRMRPYELRSDNYARQAMRPIYDATSPHWVPAAVGNAKSKVIEPYFRHLNKTYCQTQPNWSGYGVTSRREHQPSADWLNRNRKDFPDRRGAEEQLHRIIACERAARRDQYLALWQQTGGEYRLPMSDEQYLLTFGSTTGRHSALEGGGLRVRIDGSRYQYDSFDLEFRRHSHLRWKLLYDPTDMQRALAVSEDGRYRYMVEQKHLQPMALADRSAGDAEALQRVRKYNRALEEHVADIVCRAERTVQDVFRKNSELDNTYAKFVVTNSTGQHKDLVSRARLRQHATSTVAEPLPERPARRLRAVPDDETTGDDETRRFDIY
ncbi:MAG: hypothetical protein K6F98_05730 [Bacteroidales bacterium]|nr:hypothetical protein [Bacteroidales bacterium]